MKSKLKFKCLVLDHDNTTVVTTPDIQYPAFVKSFQSCGLELKLTEADFIREEYRGLRNYLKSLNQEKTKYLEKAFYDYVALHPARFYDGMKGIISRHWEAGGYVCVVSKSPEKYIRRDYRENGLSEPDRIFGLEFDEKRNKPSSYPLKVMMKAYSLEPRDLLVIDDKRSGIEMAKRCGVPSVLAGWGLALPEIFNAVQESSRDTLFLESVEALNRFLLGDSNESV